MSDRRIGMGRCVGMEEGSAWEDVYGLDWIGLDLFVSGGGVYNLFEGTIVALLT